MKKKINIIKFFYLLNGREYPVSMNCDEGSEKIDEEKFKKNMKDKYGCNIMRIEQIYVSTIS